MNLSALQRNLWHLIKLSCRKFLVSVRTREPY